MRHLLSFGVGSLLFYIQPLMRTSCMRLLLYHDALGEANVLDEHGATFRLYPDESYYRLLCGPEDME